MAYVTTPAGIDATIRSNWGWFVGLGVLFLIGGFLALVMPLLSTLAAAGFIAAALIVSGAVQVYHAFRVRSWSGFFLELLIGLIVLVGGLLIVLQPAVGILSLTLVIAFIFIAKGVSQLFLAFRMRPLRSWGWIALAGVVSVLVGVMILLGFPFSGLYALGILAGVSLMFTGWSYVALGLMAKTPEPRLPAA